MSADGYRVAIIGATGAVGGTVLSVLDERGFPVRELVPFASERSAGATVRFAGKEHACRVLAEDQIADFDLVISSAGGSVSERWAPKFAEAGALVIDKSSAWRERDGVPLVVAGVNDDALDQAFSESGRRIVASPNCSTMQMVVALNPIYRAVGLEEIVVSTYQSVSGTGQRAIEELSDQAEAVLEESEIPAPGAYPHQIAFNAIPQVDDFDLSNGYTGEELKLMNETRKILGLSPEALAISATCVRVPVFYAHSEAVRIRTEDPLSADDCRALLERTKGVVVVDDPERHEYPLATDAAGRDEVFVGRIRNDLGPDGDRCLNMWIVGDNLRKGAATNAVEIAEVLSDRGLLGLERGAEQRSERRRITTTV
jgi:aspartate-semialdehyde dehydrogenase